MHRRSSRSLARLPDTPHLARIVPHLAPEALHQIIRHQGLDACGGLVASATPAQLMSVLDADLWRSPQPGHGERFDADRFGEWLDLLADGSDQDAARTIAAMDERLVMAGFSRYVHVYDPATLSWSGRSSWGSALAGPAAGGESDDGEWGGSAGRACDVGGYRVRAIRADVWDAIVTVLFALDAEDHDRLHRLLQGCRRLSNSAPEADGLDALLPDPAQLFHDLAVDRDRRRARRGYITPEDARAFLQLARRRGRASTSPASVNPIFAAHLRAAGEASAAEADSGRRGMAPQPPRLLLGDGDSSPARPSLIRTLLEEVRHTDVVFAARSRELAFLANTLMAGCSVQSRSFIEREASGAAASICNLGLESWLACWSGRQNGRIGLDDTEPSPFLRDHDLVTAFEMGWAILYEDVSRFVAGQLITTLSDLRFGDTDTQRGLRALRTELTRQHGAGTPWRALHALEAIAVLDVPAWVGLVGLMDECPVLPAAVTATLEGRRGSISATEFEWMSTRRQLATVGAFMTRLPEFLRR